MPLGVLGPECVRLVLVQQNRFLARRRGRLRDLALTGCEMQGEWPPCFLNRSDTLPEVRDRLALNTCQDHPWEELVLQTQAILSETSLEIKLVVETVVTPLACEKKKTK